MPKIRRLVVCGLSETIATLPPERAFTSVDFPTFGRPATVTKPVFICSESTRQIPSLRQQLVGRIRDDLAVCLREGHPLEAKLVEPLAAATARRRSDRDLDQIAWPAAVDDRAGDCRPLCADPERIGGILDVHALVNLPVSGTNGCTDEVVRVGSVGSRGNRPRSLEQVVAHEKNWNTARVTSAPRIPP